MTNPQSLPNLRPLGLGELLDQAIRLYHRNFFFVLFSPSSPRTNNRRTQGAGDEVMREGSNDYGRIWNMVGL